MGPGDVFLIPLVAIVFGTGMIVSVVGLAMHHHRKLLEMKQRGSIQAARPDAEIEKLRAEIAELRETTTRYDLSFDTALQRIEGRLEVVERAQGSEAAAATQPANTL